MRQGMYQKISIGLGLLVGISLLSAAAVTSTPASNQPDIMTIDDNKPVDIESQSFHFDNKKGIAIYTHDVIADQGTRHLTAEKLYLYRHLSGEVDKMIAHGTKDKLARFQLKTSVEKPMLYGRGDIIEYHKTEQKVFLIGHAKLEQGGDVYTAPRIEYNLKTEVVRSPQSNHGRTRIILQPRNHQAQEGNTAQAAPIGQTNDHT